jgi:hypothetical protein
MASGALAERVFLPGLRILDDALLVAIVLDGLLAAWVPRRFKARVFGGRRS